MISVRLPCDHLKTTCIVFVQCVRSCLATGDVTVIDKNKVSELLLSLNQSLPLSCMFLNDGGAGFIIKEWYHICLKCQLQFPHRHAQQITQITQVMDCHRL